MHACVLKVDDATGKVSLGLKPSYLGGVPEEEDAEVEDAPEDDLDEEMADWVDVSS